MIRIKNAGLVLLGLSVMLSDGCKRQAAPVIVQPIVPRSSRVAEPAQPESPADDPVVTDAVPPVVQRRPRRRAVPQVNQPQRTMGDLQALAEAQKRRDARLLEQQTAASQRQQDELNGVVQKSVKLQQDQQAEPRIQEAPQVPITQPALPGQEAPRIQDNPTPPQAAPTPLPNM